MAEKLGFFHKKNDKNYFVLFMDRQSGDIRNYLSRVFLPHVNSGNFTYETKVSYQYFCEKMDDLQQKSPSFFEYNDSSLVDCSKQYIKMIDAASRGEKVHAYARAVFGNNSSEESQKSFQMLLDNIDMLLPSFFENHKDSQFACDSDKYKVVITDGIEQLKLEQSREQFSKGRARTAKLLQAEAKIIGGEGDEAIAISEYNMKKNSRKSRDNKLIELDSKQDYETDKKHYARGSKARENISADYKRVNLHDQDDKSFLTSILGDDYYIYLENEVKKANTKKG